MLVEFKTEDLAKGLQLVQGVANMRSTLPILNNILFKAQDGSVTISATDLEVGVTTKVAAEVREEGGITISAKKITDMVRELSGDKVLMSVVDRDRVLIQCGNGQYKMAALPPDEFPDMPEIDGQVLTLPGNALRSVLHRTGYAASTEEVRYFLNGLYFNFMDDRTDVVATDGKRMALASFEPTESENFILPLKAVREIGRVFEDSEAVSLAYSDNQMMISDKDLTLTTRLVDGEFPPYDRIIPDNPSNRVVVDRDAILAATRRVSLMSDNKNYAIQYTFDSQAIIIHAKTADVGEASESVGLDESAIDVDGITIGMDYRYLLDAYNYAETEQVAIEFEAPLNPLLIMPVGAGSGLSLVMPMRIENVEVEVESDEDPEEEYIDEEEE